MIDATQVAFYRDNGFLLIPGLLDSITLELMRNEADATIARMNQAHMDTNKIWRAWLKDEARQKQRIDSVHDMQFQAGVFSLLLTHKDLLDAMEALIGPNVQLHHTKLLAKPAGSGGAFPMHQDYPYFPHEKHTMLAVSIYLDNSDEENGCIRVIPGSHKLGPLACDPGGFYRRRTSIRLRRRLPRRRRPVTVWPSTTSRSTARDPTAATVRAATS